MNWKAPLLGLATAVTALPKLASAHCPLCVGAVGGAVAAASFFGFNPAAVGVLVGAFAIVSGQWIARQVKTQFIPLQTEAVTLASFLLTVVPSMAFSPRELFLPVLLFGSSGTVFNQVYWINLLLLGAVLGAAMVFIADWLHQRLKSKFGLLFPFQGIATIVMLLGLASAAIQFTLGG